MLLDHTLNLYVIHTNSPLPYTINLFILRLVFHAITLPYSLYYPCFIYSYMTITLYDTFLYPLTQALFQTVQIWHYLIPYSVNPRYTTSSSQKIHPSSSRSEFTILKPRQCITTTE